MPTPTDPRTVTLTSPPSLAPLLARGAVMSPLKKVKADAVDPPTRIVLTGARPSAARLDSYAEICGFDAADARNAQPVTYPHILGFPLAMQLMSDKDFPLPLLGLVHTTIDIEQRRPVNPREEAELTVYCERFVPHRRGTEAVLVTEARVEGELVWDSRSTYLARHSVPAEQRDAAESPRTEREPLPEVAEWKLPGDLGRRYGAASGDRNPIHMHPLSAKLFGFPRAIAHGMWTVARSLAEQKATGAVRVHAEFKAPVLLPGKVTYAADDSGAFELRGGERVHLTGRVTPLS